MKKAHKAFTQQEIFNLLAGHCGKCLLRPGHASSARLVVTLLPPSNEQTFPAMRIVLQSTTKTEVSHPLWSFGCN